MTEDQSEELEVEEYEEIHSDEVDRVVETIAKLMESVQSETISDYLEEASNKIFELVYDEEDVELEGEETDELEDEVDEDDDSEECEVDEDDEDEAIAA
jgi:hypothetical protein